MARAEIHQGPKVHVVGRGGADHDVAGVQEHVAQEKEQLVAAGHEHHVFDADVHLRRRPPVGRKHPVEQDLAQRAMSGGRAILERRASQGGVRPDPLHRPPRRFDRQRFVVDEADGQRNQVRLPQRPSHQRADQGFVM